jgi:hypothetical protein
VKGEGRRVFAPPSYQPLWICLYKVSVRLERVGWTR